MKYVRGKYIYLTEEDFKSLVKFEGGYKLDLTEPDLEPKREEITTLICRGTSRPVICQKYGITVTDLDRVLQRWFGTKKITEAKEKIIREQEQNKKEDPQNGGEQ